MTSEKNISAIEVAKILGTNRTYIPVLAKKHGILPAVVMNEKSKSKSKRWWVSHLRNYSYFYSQDDIEIIRNGMRKRKE